MDTTQTTSNNRFGAFLHSIWEGAEPIMEKVAQAIAASNGQPPEVMARMNADAASLLSMSEKQLQRLRDNDVRQDWRLRAAYRGLVALLSQLDSMIARYRGMLSRATYNSYTRVSQDEAQVVESTEDMPLPNVHFWDRRKSSIAAQLERAFAEISHEAESLQQATEDPQAASIPYLTTIVDELEALSEQIHVHERHLRATFGKHIK